MLSRSPAHQHPKAEQVVRFLGKAAFGRLDLLQSLRSPFGINRVGPQPEGRSPKTRCLGKFADEARVKYRVFPEANQTARNLRVNRAGRIAVINSESSPHKVSMVDLDHLTNRSKGCFKPERAPPFLIIRSKKIYQITSIAMQ